MLKILVINNPLEIIKHTLKQLSNRVGVENIYRLSSVIENKCQMFEATEMIWDLVVWQCLYNYQMFIYIYIYIYIYINNVK